ncbi:hypothetical protein SAMN06265349_101706 [Flavobacterium resistens]|uniref:Uncharacterized protein n=1 Tax=Flavobacterium resistens TaxID=443612 RepID=A0A521B5K4_9FLAO|nr:hypothetical protein [Flavobacterium resistens]MRX70291.1 hypothetical protein [Flavobacterium resistens]SMO42382.1 hypothetical protein SAMN06265349_101706 [Flavobacterium resistens]
MKIDLKLAPEVYIIISATLQPINNTKPQTRKEKSTLSIAIDVLDKIESKASSFKKQSTLFDAKKKVKITFKHHEADMLEIILIDQIKYVQDDFMRLQIQNTINLLNQKLV